MILIKEAFSEFKIKNIPKMKKNRLLKFDQGESNQWPDTDWAVKTEKEQVTRTNIDSGRKETT